MAVAIYATWFFYTIFRDPQYYEEIEYWGEIIDSALLLDFNANLHNFHEDIDNVVSVRFWPFLVVTALWIYFFSRLQLHRGIGSYVIMVRLAAREFAKFLCFWFASLFFFGCITMVWLGEFENYSTFG